jgi:hypothetical protein
VPPQWSLDNATNGDVTVALEAAICDASGSVPGQPIPEPSTGVLLVVGLVGLAVGEQRRPA